MLTEKLDRSSEVKNRHRQLINAGNLSPESDYPFGEPQ